MMTTEKKTKALSWYNGGASEMGPVALAPRRPVPTFPTATPPRDLGDYFGILKAHPWLIGLCAAAGLAAGLTFGLTSKPLYKARAAIQIESPNVDFLSTKSVNPIADDSTPNTALTDVETQLKVISSTALADRVIDRLIANGQAGPLIAQATKKPGLVSKLLHKTQTPDELDYAIRTIVTKNLSAKILNPTRAIEVTYTSPDRKFAALFANTLVDEYSDYSMEDQRETSKKTVTWLTGQLDQARQRLQDSATTVQNYATSSGLLFVNQAGVPGMANDISDTKLQQVQAELSRAQDDRVTAQSHNDVVKSVPADQLPEVVNDPRATDLHAKITDLERQRADLLTIYTENNDKVRRVDAQLAPLQAAYDSLKTTMQQKASGDYQTAVRRESLLAKTYQDEAAIVTDRANKAIQYNILKRQMDSNQQQYDALLDQIKQANIASVVKVSPIRIFDPAKAPVRPVSPDVPADSVLGLAGGLLIGVAASFAKTKHVGILSRPGTLEPTMELRELGVIPRSEARSRFASRGSRPFSISTGDDRSVSLSPRAGARKGHPAVELVAWANKEGVVAEAFRALLTSVLFSETPNRRLNVLVLTSARPLEGKTTLICNLAISMAALGRKVLLIDGDMRRPRLHQIFELPNESGLSSLLQSSGTGREADETIQKSFVPNLSVLTSGPTDFASTILLHTGAIGKLLDRLRGQYDTILIDTPPTLLTADARVIGNVADAVLLITRAGKTSSEDARTVSQLFKEDGTFVLGSIFNDYALPNKDHSYYGNVG